MVRGQAVNNNFSWHSFEVVVVVFVVVGAHCGAIVVGAVCVQARVERNIFHIAPSTYIRKLE